MIAEDKLTGAEPAVLAAFRAGDADVDVARAEIRGNFLRGLFLSKYDEKADYRGTRIVGAVIPDVLDMEFCETKFPVRFRGSSFAKEIELQQLKCPWLEFSSCTLDMGFDATSAKVAGDMVLSDGFKSEEMVGLAGAEIGGQFDCTGGNFQNKGGIAVNAQHIKVAEDVFLQDGFKANGAVLLSGAEMRGQLNCGSGSFRNAKGVALNAQGAKVDGGAFLHKGFDAEGEVSLAGAAIGEQLVCVRGSFRNKGGSALNAQGIKVASGVFLHDIKTTGETILADANIGGQLFCAGGSFENEGGVSLNARSIKVTNEALIRNLSVIGRVSLLNATIGGNFKLNDCKLTHLSLAGANVLGEFQDDAGVYKNDQGDNIDLDIDGLRYRRLEAAKERVKDRIEWAGLMSKGDEFRPQPYEQLMKVYREMGHMNWARRVGFELEKKRHKQLRLNRDHKRFVVLGWAWWFWYWILRGAIGYGYKPFRAVTRWFAPLIVAGFVLFGGMLPCPDPCRAGSEACHCMAPSDAGVLLSDDWKIHGTLPKDYPDFSPVYYAVETALPVLPLGQTENWHPKTWWVRRAQASITIIGALVLTILASYGVGVLGPRWKDE